MDGRRVRSYLDRLGVDRPERADDDALRRLQAAHLAVVPFENLSVHLGEPVDLAEDALVDKLVDRRRGGFCYELNGAFAGLLRALGFRVELLAARMYGPDGFGPPFDHLALRVETAPRGRVWLVDVGGAGRFSAYPLRFDLRTAQPDPEGTFVLVDRQNGDLDVLRDGEPNYRIEPRARSLADFEPTCWWQQTSPQSHFTRTLTCSLPTSDGRVTLSGRRLIRTVGDQRHEEHLAGPAEVLAAYRAHFGITLDAGPVLRAAENRDRAGLPGAGDRLAPAGPRR